MRFAPIVFFPFAEFTRYFKIVRTHPVLMHLSRTRELLRNTIKSLFPHRFASVLSKIKIKSMHLFYSMVCAHI